MIGPALIVCLFWLGLFTPTIPITQYFASPPPAEFLYQEVVLDEVSSITITPTTIAPTTTTHSYPPTTPPSTTVPPPPTTAAPPPPPTATGAEQWRDLVASVWPGDQVDRALCVIQAESRGDPNAENPNSSAVGLFQVMHDVWGDYFGYSYESLKDPTINTKVALGVWLEQGWTAWSVIKKGIC